ncbi:hypothetical protein MHUMG1_02799 [Metarhizium humberi]|uniref:Pleckstrin homology domain-containing protein n=1 Tax=Metarhizium humberi TaxID=2596975 RepID=A0A9P8MGK3_9HYPO|nr:hypothetical protein MHUMG1_02799 [Metarhizium humberi]
MSTDRTDKRSSRDVTNDETISILDPRRFTPTLHANLVSEILALRRDQDEKTKQIESLENALHSVKEEHEQLQESLTSSSKESRSLKRQLSLLEGGTSSALGELAKERDEAVDSISETKKRLNLAQKKIRSQEDDSLRVHELWAQEKDGWEDERRKYERKLHIAESRLKVVLDEVAAYQANFANKTPNSPLHDHESDVEESGKENDAVSVRTMSMTNSIRHSLMSGPILHPGNSLADELTFDDDDQTDVDGRESVLSIRTSPKHMRTFSRDSVAGRLHLRNHSIESPKRPGSVARGKLFMNPSVLEALEGEDEETESQTFQTAVPGGVSYIDSGIQYSPPPSPPALRFKSSTPDAPSQCVKTPEHETPSRADTEIEANQRKKRVQVVQPLVIEHPKHDNKMVSAAAQTVEMPLSPPKTPQTPFLELEHVPVLMVTSSTQTEEVPAVASDVGLTPPSRRASSLPPLDIPTINIQPPTSRPTTPREPRLPQHFKHFGCQVNLSSILPTNDASMQTEGIQVDKRLALLPAHLQPSSISSRPTSPNVSKPRVDSDFTPVPPRNPRRLTNSHDRPELASSPATSRGDDEELQDSYLNLHGDQQLLAQKGVTRHSNRISSIFAGFDTASSDEGDEFGDLDGSDAEYRTALSAPRPQSNSTRATKRGSFGTATTSSEQQRPKPLTRNPTKPIGPEPYNSFGLADKENQPKAHGRKLSRAYEKPHPAPAPGSSNRTSAIRKAAIIQSGIVTQQSRSRSPSLPDGKYPPFPIPNRASSRRSQIGLYTPSDGRESPTRGEIWHRRGSSRSSYQSHSIRKVRSAAALPRAHRYRRHGSRSPPPLSPSTEAPESPGLPPLPQNDITTPRNGRDRGFSSYRKHRHDLSTNTDNTNNTVPTTDTGFSHTTGVVDAIAQTMVGEWMLKYVRRRKSFSVPENTGKDDSSNDRHKRWVWLAPYERSILWSSKQPSSGSALLGKTGRKLTIQSVLDVKDDNPAPRVMPTVFNRSILILTPQRALKFTASSAERHYLWLTALSFLAHSSQAVPEIISTPHTNTKEQQHQPLPEFEAPQPKHKRSGIRDSIRLAKGRTATKISVPGVPSIPSVPTSRRSEATGFRLQDSSSAISGGHSREQSGEAAEPPFIPRFSERTVHSVATHGRKRSNTGGHVAPPLSFRGFSGPAGTGSGPHHSGQSTANGSLDTTMSSEVYQSQASTNTTWNMSQTASSQRTSEASSRPSNFFDAIGTVRMEAFISPLAYSQYTDYPDDQCEEYRKNSRRRSKEIRRRNSRNRHRDSYSYRAGRSEDSYSRGRFPVEEDYFLRDDPFKGF